MHKMQNANNAATAKCVYCGGCKMQTMQRLGVGSASGLFSLSMGRSDDRPADPCQATRHGSELAGHAAPCANPPSGPILGTVPTGTL